MLITRAGTQGTIALVLPETFKPAAEKVLDALAQAYPQATVRVVCNHSLAPEIVRVDRIDPTFARSVVEQLRSHAPPAPAREASSLHEQIAACLGWSVEETRDFSLSALRTLVHKHDPRLAAAVERAMASDPGSRAYCCFCSGVVEPADYVVYAHVPGSDRPAHKACVDAATARKVGHEFAGDPERTLARLAFEISPSAAWSHINPREHFDALSDDELRAMCLIVLAGLPQ